MGRTKIADIYAGLPDAKEAIQYEGIQDFLDAFVIPPDSPLEENLVRGKKMFVTGNKGLGKTATLRYLNHMLSRQNESTKSSFILFEQDYQERRKAEMVNQVRRSVVMVDVEKGENLYADDFSSIWRWHIFMTLLRNNGNSSKDSIFFPDEAWKKFSQLVTGVVKPDFAPRLSGSISVELPFFGVLRPEITLSLPEFRLGKEKLSLADAMNEATNAFVKLWRTNIPYYLFIDELDVYRGGKDEYLRDLRMVRDLILETKKLNTLMQSAGWSNSKIFCAIRPEILRAIDREFPGSIIRQVSGFDLPLVWTRNTRETYTQPIMQLLMRRIEKAEEKNGERKGTEEERYRRWFPLDAGEEPASIIRQITWSRPRDIVRFLTCAGNVCGRQTAFTNTVFQAVRKEYSAGSLEEIKGELKAIYTSVAIDQIFDCLRGMPAFVSLEAMHRRTQSMNCYPVAEYGLNQVLGDLYRVGVIGQKQGDYTRWQHEGEDGFFFSNDWLIAVHPGLYEALYIQKVEGQKISSSSTVRNEALQDKAGNTSAETEALSNRTDVSSGRDEVQRDRTGSTATERNNLQNAGSSGREDAARFGLSDGQLQLLAQSRKSPSLYFESFKLKTHGKVRDLIRYTNTKNGDDIRNVHSVLVYNMQKQYLQHDASFAYRPGGSIVKCVSVHQNSRCFLKFDIHHFFNSINADILAEEIRAQFGLGSVPANQLKDFVRSFFIDGILPLGLVISPLLSDIYLHSLDVEMQRLCSGSNCVYSRYADDIMISGSVSQMKRASELFRQQLVKLLAQKSLQLNESKTKMVEFDQPGQYIRYVGVNIVCAETGNVLTVGRSYIHELAKEYLDYARRKFAARYKRPADMSEADMDYLFYQGRRLAGKIQFIRQVEGEAGPQKLIRRLLPHLHIGKEEELTRFCLVRNLNELRNFQWQ